MKQSLFFTGMVLTCLFYSCSKNNPSPSGGPNGNSQPPTSLQAFSPDNSFTGIGGSGYSAALQSDGKVIVTGSFGSNFSYSYKVYRLNRNGGIDNTFNIDVDKTWAINNFSYVAVTPDGKILLAGDFTVNGARKILIRLTSTGALDDTSMSPLFNTINNSTLPYISKIIVQGDGKILIAGHFNISNGEDYVVRMNSSGEIDNTFSFSPVSNGANEIDDILLMPDGKMLVSGYFALGTGTSQRHVIVKLNTDGSVDPSFNFIDNVGNTLLGNSYSGIITRMALQSDGKIVIGGGFLGIIDKNARDNYHDYNRIARLNADGSSDLTFNSTNVVSRDVTSLVVLPDDRILAGRNISLNTVGDDCLSLFSKDGVMDSSFKLGYTNSGITQIIKQDNIGYLLVGSFNDSANQGIIRITGK